MKKILKELCIGLFTIVLLNSSNLVNVFAAENSSVSESENFFKTLYLIFDYPYKYYTFKHFEV